MAANEDGSRFKSIILDKYGISSPVEHLHTTEPKHLAAVDIILRYAIAEEGNPWNYQAGTYLITNLTIERYQTDPAGYSLLLSTNALADLLPALTLLDPPDRNVFLDPKYIGPDDGLIFQIS